MLWTPKTDYKEGEKLSFSLLANRDSYLVVNYEMADGKSLKLFPNDFWTDNFIRGGQTLTIPSQMMSSKFDLEVQAPFGTERIVVYASTSKIDAIPSNAIGIRGIKISGKKQYEEFSEAVLQVSTSR